MSTEPAPRPRIAAPPPDSWTAEQRRAAEIVRDGPRRGLYGPFLPLLHSPGLMEPLQGTGVHLRYLSAVPRHLFEFTVLMVATHWNQTFEFEHHAPCAEQAGVSPDDIAAVREHRAPAARDLAPVFTLVTELLRTGRVSAAAYAPVAAALPTEQVVDLLGIVGYYTTLAFLMNVADAEEAAGDTSDAAPVAAGPDGH